MVTRALAVRARLAARRDHFERLYDSTLDDLVRRGPVARERFPAHWSDTDGLRRLAEAKRRALPPALARALAEEHKRLGASPASLAALDRLARGDAVCAIAGQQPAPLGGPLYAFHKAASAIGLAAAFEARTGVPCVPVYWMHGEDSDFEEIRHATFADPALTLHDRALPESAHREGGMVGNLPLDPVRSLDAEACAAWSPLPGAREAAALLERAAAPSRDLGDAHSALLLALFGAQGMVVVDPRLPAFRAAARPILDRYLAAPAKHSEAARRAGEWLESNGARRTLNDAALESFVFAIEDGTRRKVDPAEAPRAAALSPSVALRPVVQDGVLPTVAMACGPGEAAYLAQLREVFEGLGVTPACPVPRLGATWLPPAAVELLEASGAEPWELISNADAVVRRLARSQVPAEVQTALEQARRSAFEGLERFASASRRVDPSLPQMVDSARAKVDYQFQRLEEGLAGKVRHQLERRHPEWVRLRYYLLPGDRLQERRLAGMELVAYRGAGVGVELAELAGRQAEALAAGTLEHLVVDLG